MLQRCPPEEKENTGNEILKICRSLYDTKHVLPVKVRFNFRYHGYESCFEVPSTRKMYINIYTINAGSLRELGSFCLKKRWLSLNRPMRKHVEEMEPVSSQKCLVIGQDTSYIIKNSHYIQGNNFSPWQWWNIGIGGCLEETSVSSLFLEVFRTWLDHVMGNLILLDLLWVGAGWINWPLEVCSSVNYSLKYL